MNTKTGVEKTICLRGAFLTDNKTSQCEAEGVRDRVFGFGRGLLQGWKAKFVSMFGSEEPCTIPDPTSYRLARFHDGSSIMSDGCNQAQKMQQVMKEMIKEGARQHRSFLRIRDGIGQDQRSRCLHHGGDCRQGEGGL